MAYPVFAAGLLEGAESQGGGAAVLQVPAQVLPGDVGGPALIRTGHGVAGALVLVVLEREEKAQRGVCRITGSPWLTTTRLVTV